MRSTRALLAAVALALGLASPATAERGIARNGLAVAGTAERIEVFSHAGLGGSDYFCAAGDFARSRLGARAADRIEIVSGLGPSATRPGQWSVVFALTSARRGNAGLDAVLLRPRAVGTNRSVAHAAHLCTLPRAPDEE